MAFHEMIALVRENKGLTRTDLGNLIGVNSNMVGKYERGDITPPLDVVINIAQVLDCSIDYLVGFTEENIKKSAIPGKLKPLLNKLERLSPADMMVAIAVVDGLIAKSKL